VIKEFRDFLMRGNLIVLAVAFIMGGAFGSVTTAFTEDIVNPLIAMFGGRPSFNNVLILHGAHFKYGAFLTALIAFLITAAVVFFLIVKPVAVATARLVRKAEAEGPAEPSDEERRHQELLTALGMLRGG
jgi:large conductance mechanosensitive channel